MTERIHGTSFTSQSLTADLQYYECYAASPFALTSPDPNPSEATSLQRLVNIQVTQNIKDESQKNFELLLMSISLRAMPVVMNNPVPVIKLSDYTTQLSGEGFVWKFGVERGVQFYNYSPYGIPGPVGLLISDLNGIVLSNGVRITTIPNDPSGWQQNVAFSLINMF